MDEPTSVELEATRALTALLTRARRGLRTPVADHEVLAAVVGMLAMRPDASDAEIADRLGQLHVGPNAWARAARGRRLRVPIVGRIER